MNTFIYFNKPIELFKGDSKFISRNIWMSSYVQDEIIKYKNFCSWSPTVQGNKNKAYSKVPLGTNTYIYNKLSIEAHEIVLLIAIGMFCSYTCFEQAFNISIQPDFWFLKSHMIRFINKVIFKFSRFNGTNIPIYADNQLFDCPPFVCKSWLWMMLMSCACFGPRH